MEGSHCRQSGERNFDVDSIPVVDLEKDYHSSDTNGTESSDFVIEETSETATFYAEENDQFLSWPPSSLSSVSRSTRGPTKVLPKRVDSKKGRKYICKQCGYATTSYSNITSHFKYLHPRLAKNGNLYQHYRTIVNAQGFKRVPVMYFCQHCNYITLNLRGFMLHSSRIHPKRKANPFKQGTPITTTANRKYLEALCLSKEEPKKSKKKAHKLLKAYHPDSQLFFNHPKYSCKASGSLNKPRERSKDVFQPRPRRELSSRTFRCGVCYHICNSAVELCNHYMEHNFDDAGSTSGIQISPERRQDGDEAQLHVDYSFENLEKIDDTLSSFFQDWSRIIVTESHSAGCNIPCVVCEFSTDNLILLLKHYHGHHNNCYPKGFHLFLKTKLVSRIKTIVVRPSEAVLIDEQATWITDNNQLIQYCEYSCELCNFKSDWFSPMLDHVKSKHAATTMSPLQFIEKKSSVLPNLSFTSFLQCSFCCHVEFTRMNMVMHYKNVHMEDCQSMELDDAFCMSEKRHCKDCDYTGNYDALQWHSIEKHNCPDMRWSSLQKVSSFGYTELKCCSCHYVPSDNMDLILHYQNQHFKEAVTFSSSVVDGSYRCLSCGSEILTLGCVASHSCFSTKNNLVNNPEEGLKYSACKICQKVFDNQTTEADVCIHVLKEHYSNALPFTVDDLPANALKYGHWIAEYVPSSEKHGNANSLAQKRHEYSSPPGCDLIDSGSATNKTVTARKSLKQQLTRDTQNCIKCKFCFTSVTSERNLVEHLTKSHHSVLKLRCFGCDEHFSTAVECREHHQQLHGVVLDDRTAFHFLLDDVSPSSKDKERHVCVWCGFNNSSNLIVLNHFNSSHVTNLKRKRRHFKNGSYSCRWCQYTTKNITSMRGHINSKHGKVVSYHSLGNFTSDDPNTSDSSDSDYHPSKEFKNSRAKSCARKSFTFSQICKMDDEDEFSDPEVYKTTHSRHKHRNRYPYVCSFCKKCFLCSTAFLNHCEKQHKDLCVFRHVNKHAVCLPEPSLIPRLQQKLRGLHDFECSESIFYDAVWPCVLCSTTSASLQKFQEHIFYTHNGKKVFMCKYCNFLTTQSREIIEHVQCHTAVKEVRLDDTQSDRRENMVIDLDEDVIADVEEPESSETVSPLVKRPPNARKSIRTTSHQFDSTNLKILKVTSKNAANSLSFDMEHFTNDAGLLRCRDCEFSCSNADQAKEHVDSEHAPLKELSCKFCRYRCQDLADLDAHLADFHKIEKNHQLGLPAQSVAYGNTSEPTSSLPLWTKGKSSLSPSLNDKDDVIIIDSDDEDDATVTHLKDEEGDDPVCKDEPAMLSDAIESAVVESMSLQCPYCGYNSTSMQHHKRHLKRHEI